MIDSSLKSSFSISEAFTGISIVVSILALLYAWHKDRLLKKKEYADRIRHAASSVTAKLERWRELSLRFFDDIQPLITDVDGVLLKHRDVIVARDSLWRGLVTARAESSRRILDEQIEIAYADLYGYDARIRDLFAGGVDLLKEIDERIFREVLKRTQADVLALSGVEATLQSAKLGNALRETCADLATQLAAELNTVLVPFRQEMIKLIEASDSQIVSKAVGITSGEEVFKHVNEHTHKEDGWLDVYRNAFDLALDRESIRPTVERKGNSILRSYHSGGEAVVRSGTLADVRAGGAVELRSKRLRKKRQVSAASFVTAEDLTGIVYSDPEIMGGTPVFVGTRVPLENLIDYLEGAESVEEFLRAFPAVSRDQVNAVIEAGKRKIIGTE